MRRAHHVQPLRGIDLVGADHRPHIVIENFGRRPRQSRQSGVFQTRKIAVKRFTQAFRAMGNFQRRKRMDMNVRRGSADGLQQAAIGVAIELGVDTTLHAHFCCAARHRFGGTATDFLVGQDIGRPAQILRPAFGKCAKGAAVQTYIGVVDIAIDHESHGLARSLRAQDISSLCDARHIGPFCGKQRDDIALVKPFARARDDRLDRCRGQRPPFAHDRRRRDLRTRTPRFDHGQPACIDRATHHRSERTIKPQVRLAGKNGADRQPFDQVTPGRSGRLGQCIEMRPRRFGIHMIGRNRRHAAPVVDPGCQQSGQPVRL